MTVRKLTIAEARDLPYEDLLARVHGLVEGYAVPFGDEPTQERMMRLERTLDELPDVYSWLMQLESWFDHWTDLYATQFGLRSTEYKQMRERRDAMERAAKAAKLRYEGASRVLTRMLSFDEASRMPHGRS